ncbi:MAG: hypothetical protein GXO15_01515 [Crenarchaeota archaeon]|nr:hypothetical protein [Thermoproteota archaeon]
MAKSQRSAVLDVRAACEHVLRHIAGLDPFSVVEGAARVVSRGEGRRGELIVHYASALGREYRVVIRVRREGDRIEYVFEGDMKGSMRIAGLPRGGGCRLYIEAEAEGKLLDEYGGDALGRIVNRVVVAVVDRFPAVLQPRLPRGKLGDAFVELLELLNLAVGGAARVASGGRIKTLAVNLETSGIVSFDGITEEEAKKIAPLLAEGLRSLLRRVEEAGLGTGDRVVVSLGDRVLVAGQAAGLSVITILEKSEGEE